MSQPDSGESHQLAIEKLHHHPKNAEFYGEPDDITDLVASIEDIGFDDNEPIEIIQEPRSDWPANRIISGHRRHEAARQAGLDKVPVRTVDFENEDEELNYLLQKNRYRQKTDGMLIREGMWYEKQIRNGDIEAEGRVRDAVGERINMSGRSYQKGREVAKAADEGDEIAQEQWGLLEADEQSIHGAYTVTLTMTTVKREKFPAAMTTTITTMPMRENFPTTSALVLSTWLWAPSPNHFDPR